MLVNHPDYIQVIDDIKLQIQSARHRAVLGANKELICLYWTIGKIINENSTWGSKFIETLAKDIKLAFPQATGYSVRNLKYMAKFQRAYEDFEFVQQVVAQIPWGQNLVLLDKIQNTDEQIWYACKVLEHGWSRAVLTHQIELQLYQRQVLSPKISNFQSLLPASQSELATQTLKDPDIFRFYSTLAGYVRARH